MRIGSPADYGLRNVRTVRRLGFSDHVLACFWVAAGELPFVDGRFFKLILLTGLLRNEVLVTHRSDVDGTTWRVAGRYGKRLLPITGLIGSLLRECLDAPRQDDSSERVFLWSWDAYGLLRDKMEAHCKRCFPGRNIKGWNSADITFTAVPWLKKNGSRALYEHALRAEIENQRRILQAWGERVIWLASFADDAP